MCVPTCAFARMHVHVRVCVYCKKLVLVVMEANKFPRSVGVNFNLKAKRRTNISF